ncbi:tubulin-tyrosine ligase family protein (macronuclear) [Tetrahymena thermophila SB210]|uniref:Tubulin-tyrosine ligase family protein n=1 Tax=Tetrahymena thermophila (strain SB210) TaxID=312017 RepID=I7MAB1_TETTS|nr:tubulin-tyrosine ligase family protein [Tetrahymena thermophila SB210]EAS04250.2 tubulin-tyrosine ligase family protein [Tetrahymena thermophila SB210]|eukprot:XP_001024495.2 tubulin-tyrosine ligase family protein [Tetrahymena thermophila SB210]
MNNESNVYIRKSKNIKQQAVPRNSDEIDMGNSRRANEKENSSRLYQNIGGSLMNNIGLDQIKIGNTSQYYSAGGTQTNLPSHMGLSQNSGISNQTTNSQGSNSTQNVILTVTRIVPYQQHPSQTQQLQQQILNHQQQQQLMSSLQNNMLQSSQFQQQSGNQNIYYQNYQQSNSQKGQMNSPTRRFVQNQKPLQNGQSKKTQSIGNIQQQQQQVTNASIEKTNETDDVNSPGGPRQISIHYLNGQSSFQGQVQQNNLSGQSMGVHYNAQKKSMNHIEMEESGGQGADQSGNCSGLDKSPKFKPQTKFPPITKGSSAQSSQNTSNYKLQKIKMQDKEVRKNIVALDSISRMDQFTGLNQVGGVLGNNTFKILKQGQQQGSYYNQFNKAIQESNGILAVGNSLNQLDMDIKGIIPQENPHYYPSYKVKRANPNQKHSKDFHTNKDTKENGDNLYLEVVNSKQMNEVNHNFISSQQEFNQNYPSTAGQGEGRENKFIENYSAGQEDANSNDINRSSSTPMLLKKEATKRLEKIKHHNTIEGNGNENEQQNNRYEKITSQKINAVLGSNSSKHVVTIQKKEKSKLNLNRFEDSDRESDHPQLNPLTQKKYSHNGQSVNAKKPISGAIQANTSLKPIKILKKQQEGELSENQNAETVSIRSSNIDLQQTPQQSVKESGKKAPKEEQISSSNNTNQEEDYQGDDEDFKGSSNLSNQAKQNYQNNKGTDFFKINPKENQLNQNERASSNIKGAIITNDQSSFEKTPQMRKKTYQQKQAMNLGNNQIKQNGELDNILNDSIQKAPLNIKTTKEKEAKLSEQTIQNNADINASNKKKQKKKKKRNTLVGPQGGQNNGLSSLNQGQMKNGQLVGKYDNLPKEVQRINQYQDFIRAVNFSNNIDVIPIQKPCFKMYVGKGNNSYLIKSSVKQRWWLQLETNKDKVDQCHIVWTQLRFNEFLNNLKAFTGPRITTDNQILGSEQKINIKTNDSFADTNNNNDASTNFENSPLLDHKMNSSINKDLDSQSQLQGDLGNAIDSSDSETEKLRSLTSRPTVKKSNSLNNSLSSLKAELKKGSPNPGTANSQPQNKETRSLTPSTRGNAPQNQLKVQATYNVNAKRLFHPNDFKKIMEIQPNKDYDLRYFFSQSLPDQFQQFQKEFDTFQDPNSLKMHNHLENNWNLSNKKALFYNLRNYYTTIKQNPFENIPLTFHIKDGINDPEYTKFLEHWKQKEDECNQKEKLRLEYKYSSDKAKQSIGSNMKKPRNIWIIKPGEITNRGTGITVLNEIDQITQLLAKNDLHPNGKPKTYIVQKYLDNPLLYNKRKFDIRCYLLVTVIKGRMKAYWYQDGYIRTSCKEYNCKSLTNKMIHLTNDAVQKKCEDYGKYEPGNKLSYNDLQRYLDQNHTEQKINFQTVIYPRMRQLALDCIKSTFLKMDPQRREITFEVFGLDYMIDEEFKTWLIEVNTNPCLELSSPLLARIIPAMIENAFRIAIDPIFGFPPINDWSASAKKTFIPDSIMENNKFELIFDEAFDGPSLQALFAQYNEQQQDIIIEEEEEEEEEIEDEQ